jgi:hypothetical protein
LCKCIGYKALIKYLQVVSCAKAICSQVNKALDSSFMVKHWTELASPPRGRPSGHLTLATATLTSPPLAAPLPERAAGCSCGPRGRRRRGSLFSSPADWGGHGCLVLPEASSSALSGWRRRRLGPPDPVFPRLDPVVVRRELRMCVGAVGR